MLFAQLAMLHNVINDISTIQGAWPTILATKKEQNKVSVSQRNQYSSIGHEIISLEFSLTETYITSSAHVADITA